MARRASPWTSAADPEPRGPAHHGDARVPCRPRRAHRVRRQSRVVARECRPRGHRRARLPPDPRRGVFADRARGVDRSVQTPSGSAPHVAAWNGHVRKYALRNIGRGIRPDTAHARRTAFHRSWIGTVGEWGTVAS